MILKPQLLFTISCLHFISSHAHIFQTYIIQLRPNSHFPSKLHYHLSFLKTSSRLLYSYESSFEGFSAQLTTSELKTLKTSKNIVSIKPDRKLHLHTTYSHSFLGLTPSTPTGPWAKSNSGQGQIIGLLDTGAWPESPSFNDRNMPPIPSRWRGTCQNFTCNKKIIGARFFHKGHTVSSSLSEYISPRDSHGHGTHTASTAAGSRVPSAGVFGLGTGEAYGMAPKAHIAIYKVCWFNGCYSSDILAAMDSAITDGVDVISLSLGGFPVPLYDDTIAVGSFRAVERGIIVVCSAGNNGPIVSSVANEAPWIVTVGASMMDRKFPAEVQLGSKFLYGESMYPGKRKGKRIEKELELVSGEFCLKGTLDRTKVKGKMVVCERGINGRAEKGEIVKEAGGYAMILTNTEVNMEEDSVDVHVLPATLIGYKESNELKIYMNSTVRARIVFGGTVIGESRAPAVAQFSSRGPSLTDPSILKPDLIAPGVNIVAAWPENLGPSNLPEDSRRVNFTVMSGTSMSCPHVSGVVALIQSVHPRWTPAGVKSALMTSADVVDRMGKPIMDGDKKGDVFAVGAGHVNPRRAIDPGLIYDVRPDDYVTHLCAIGYGDSEVFSITHRNVSCGGLRKRGFFGLNYPSFSVVFRGGEEKRMVRRRVTNVGKGMSVYEVEMEAPEGVRMRVRPPRLVFKRVNQSLSYKVWFVSEKRGVFKNAMFGEGHLAWVERSGFYRVRSPISVTWTS